MCQHQCPNCGGYKTYSWRAAWLGGAVQYLPPIAFCVLVGFKVPILWLGAVALIAVKVIEYRFSGWKRSHVCELCSFNFDPDPHAAPVAAKPHLQTAGDDYLARQQAYEEEVAANDQWWEDFRARG